MRLFGKDHSDGVVGLDVEDSFISAMQLDGQEVARSASTDLLPGLVVDGEIVDPERLTEVLKSLFRDSGLPRRVWLGVANRHIALRELAIPRIADPEQRHNAVRFQTSESIVMPLDEAILDYQVVGEREGPQGATLDRIIVVAARRTMIKKLISAVRGAGLKPEGVDLSAFALVRALDGAGAPRKSRLLCHLGGVTHLAIVEGNVCVFARPLDTSFDGHTVDAGTLGEELRLSIDYQSAQGAAEAVEEVLLAGPGAAVEGLADELEAVLHLPVVAAPPFPRLLGPALPSGDAAYKYTVSAGLALGAAA
jgi:type IV pilus assembly protein PilM